MLKRLLQVSLLFILISCTESRQLSLMEQAEEKINAAQYPEAVELLKRTIAINPESRVAVKALYKLGFTQESYTKDMDGSLLNYQEFIRLSQDNVAIYEVQKRIANIYFEQTHDPEKAIAAYKKLISFSPDSLEIDFFQFRIAQGYFHKNNFEQARLEYQTLLDRFPKSQYNARARFEIGNAYYMEGKYDIAIEALKQVLRNHPQSEYSVEAQFVMAQCYEHQEKHQTALQMYENIHGRYSSPDVLEIRLREVKKRLKQTK